MHQVDLNTHRTLIEKSKKGDRTAQYALYELYIDAMYNTCFRMLKNSEDAEDITQEAFVKAFTKLASFKYQSTFGAWLKRIVINSSITFLNKRKIHFCELDDSVYNEKIEETIEQHWTIEHIKSGMAQLSDGYRRILSLYLIEGYDHQEISQITGISVSTSKSQYHRAKKRLLEYMNN